MVSQQGHSIQLIPNMGAFGNRSSDGGEDVLSFDAVIGMTNCNAIPLILFHLQPKATNIKCNFIEMQQQQQQQLPQIIDDVNSWTTYHEPLPGRCEDHEIQHKSLVNFQTSVTFFAEMSLVAVFVLSISYIYIYIYIHIYIYIWDA